MQTVLPRRSFLSFGQTTANEFFEDHIFKSLNWETRIVPMTFIRGLPDDKKFGLSMEIAKIRSQVRKNNLTDEEVVERVNHLLKKYEIKHYYMNAKL